MAAKSGKSTQSAAKGCVRKMAQMLRDVKKGSRKFLATLLNRFYRSTAQNYGKSSYTTRNGLQTCTNMEGLITDQQVKRMLYKACDTAEAEFYKLDRLIREAYQHHRTNANENSDTWTIQQLTRMLVDLEQKARELTLALGNL